MSGGRHFAGGVRGWPDNGGPDMRGGGGPDGRTGAQVAALTDRTTRTHQTRGRIRGAEIPGVEPVSPMVRPRRAGGAAAGWVCGRWSPLTLYLSIPVDGHRDKPCERSSGCWNTADLQGPHARVWGCQ